MIDLGILDNKVCWHELTYFQLKLFLQHEIIAWWIFHEKIDSILSSEDSLAPLMEQQARRNSHNMTLNVIERVKKRIIFIEKRTNKIKRNFGGLKNQQPERIMKNVVNQSRLIFETILIFNTEQIRYRKSNAIKPTFFYKIFFLQIRSNQHQSWQINEEIHQNVFETNVQKVNSIKRCSIDLRFSSLKTVNDSISEHWTAPSSHSRRFSIKDYIISQLTAPEKRARPIN